MLRINELKQLYLGIQGENLAQTLTIDVSDWLVNNPNGSVTIWHKRNGDSVPSATGAVFDPEEKTISWSPTDTDTYAAGEGVAEIRLTEGNVIKKTRAVRTGVSPAVTLGGTPLGSSWQDYINAVDYIRSKALEAQEAAEDAQEAAEEAQVAAEEAAIQAETVVTKWPRIEGYTWRVWNAENNCWIDTGIDARGRKGEKGDKGDKGDRGAQGERGPAGPQGIQGIQGIQGVQGVEGPAGRDGINGIVIAVTADEYGFSIDDNGHLILTYEGGAAPDFSIDENGHLIYTY